MGKVLEEVLVGGWVEKWVWCGSVLVGVERWVRCVPASSSSPGSLSTNDVL